MIKERNRALINMFPFKKIPGRIIIELILFVELWLNQEPSSNGVTDFYSPRNIIIGHNPAYNKNYKFSFGSSVEAHNNRKIINNMNELTVSGIFLEPTANF